MADSGLRNSPPHATVPTYSGVFLPSAAQDLWLSLSNIWILHLVLLPITRFYWNSTQQNHSLFQLTWNTLIFSHIAFHVWWCVFWWLVLITYTNARWFTCSYVRIFNPIQIWVMEWLYYIWAHDTHFAQRLLIYEFINSFKYGQYKTKKGLQLETEHSRNIQHVEFVAQLLVVNPFP